MRYSSVFRTLFRVVSLSGRVFASIALLLVCSAADAAAASPAFPLRTSGRFIVDSNGTRVRLNGVNWYGAESSDFVVAGLQVASLQSIVQQIKSFGFNVVRLPWSNQLYETNPVVGSYALSANPSMEGENALTILDQVIAALTNAGIMVILDNHNSNAEWCCSTADGNSLWYNSQYPQANWIADWQGMVQRYQNNPLVIGVDLRNEPRSPATWGGSSADDWHAAAQLGGNAVLNVNPNLLIFVEGVNYATDLSGAATLPIQLNLPHQLVYEAHNYGFDYSNLTSYSDYMSRMTSAWGYLVTGNNPQPLWLGEFGTCNTSATCINSGSNGDLGYWFNMITAFVQQYGVDWTYWAANGTQSTGNTRTYGAGESYGVFNSAWNAGANPSLTTRLQGMMANAPAGFTLVGSGTPMIAAQGGTVTATVAVVPGNGFSGTVNLSCSVSGPSGSVGMPTCSVSSAVSVASSGPTSATVTIVTAGSAANTKPTDPSKLIRTASGAVAACGVLLIGSFVRRRAILLSLLAVIATIGLTGFSGCGSASATSGGATQGTSAGTYSVVVIGSANGASSASTQIALTVQ